MNRFTRPLALTLLLCSAAVQQTYSMQRTKAQSKITLINTIKTAFVALALLGKPAAAVTQCLEVEAVDSAGNPIKFYNICYKERLANAYRLGGVLEAINDGEPIEVIKASMIDCPLTETVNPTGIQLSGDCRYVTTLTKQDIENARVPVSSKFTYKKP